VDGGTRRDQGVPTVLRVRADDHTHARHQADSARAHWPTRPASARWWATSGAARSRSRMMVTKTLAPSRNVRSALSPYSRLRSKLDTSTTRSFARATRVLR